jgi:hypothetical protein
MELESKLSCPFVSMEPFDRVLSQLDRARNVALDMAMDMDELKPVDEVTLQELGGQQAKTDQMLLDLEHLGKLVETQIDFLRGWLVNRCRQLQMSWSQIAVSLDMTPQGAQKLHARWLASQGGQPEDAASGKPSEAVTQPS